MKKTVSVIVGCLSLLTGSCARQPGGEQPKGRSESEIAANTKAQQARLGQAFYDALVPRMKSCWPTSGRGEIEFTITYRRTDTRWEWQQAEIAKTDVSDEAKTAALDCLRNTSRGSGFATDQSDAAAAQQEYVVHWGWPVPFPDNTSDLAAMISTGSGGGNRECPKTCVDCVGEAGKPGTTQCVAACSGWVKCTEDGTGNGCRMTGGICATGWSGVWAGSAFIASNGDLQIGPPGQDTIR